MPGHSLDVSHKQWALSAIARDSSSWLTSPLVLGQGATSATYSCVGFTSSWVWLFVFPPLVHLHKPPLHCSGNGGKLRLLLLFRGTPSVVFSSVVHLGACGDCAFLGLSPNVLTPELWGEALIWVLRSPPGEAACHTLEFEHPWTTDSNNGCPSRFTEALPKIHLREMAFGFSCAVNRCKI